MKKKIRIPEEFAAEHQETMRGLVNLAEEANRLFKAKGAEAGKYHLSHLLDAACDYYTNYGYAVRIQTQVVDWDGGDDDYGEPYLIINKIGVKPWRDASYRIIYEVKEV